MLLGRTTIPECEAGTDTSRHTHDDDDSFLTVPCSSSFVSSRSMKRYFSSVPGTARNTSRATPPASGIPHNRFPPLCHRPCPPDHFRLVRRHFPLMLSTMPASNGVVILPRTERRPLCNQTQSPPMERLRERVGRFRRNCGLCTQALLTMDAPTRPWLDCSRAIVSSGKSESAGEQVPPLRVSHRSCKNLFHLCPSTPPPRFQMSPDKRGELVGSYYAPADAPSENHLRSAMTKMKRSGFTSTLYLDPSSLVPTANQRATRNAFAGSGTRF